MELKNSIPKIVEAMQRRTEAVYAAMQDGLVKGMRDFEATMIKEQFSGRPGLNRRHGGAARSWFITVKGIGQNISAVLANQKNAWYIKVHEHADFNGNIKPKNSQFLTIPLNPAAVRMREDNNSLRNVGNLVFIKTYKGGGYDYYLVQFNSKRIIPMFKLVRNVFIPKRLHIISDFKRNGGGFVKLGIITAVDKAMSARRVR